MSTIPCDSTTIGANIPVPSEPVLIFMLIAYPILTVLGTIGNLISAFILHPFRTHISGHVYLSCLAIFDTLSLIFNLISFWNVLILKRYFIDENNIVAAYNIDRLFGSQGICEIRIYLTFTVRMWSVWTVVILTTERFLLIISPLRFQKFLRPKVAWITIACSTLLIALINLPWLFSFNYVIQKDCSPGAAPGATLTRCITNQTFLICRIIEFVFTVFVPGIILLVENTKIAATLSERRRFWLRVTDHRGSNLHKGSDSAISSDFDALDPQSSIAQGHLQARRKERQLTVRLFLVSIVFWVLSMPSFLVISIQTLMERMGYRKQYLSGPLADAFHIAIFLFILNLSINFIIYCAVGTTFRKAFQALVTCRLKAFMRLRDTLCRDIATEHCDMPDQPVGGVYDESIGRRLRVIEHKPADVQTIGMRLKFLPSIQPT